METDPLRMCSKQTPEALVLRMIKVGQSRLPASSTLAREIVVVLRADLRDMVFVDEHH